MTLKISIILVSFNSQELLSKCLTSLYSFLAGGDNFFEVIVVDNCSSDNTCKMVISDFTKTILVQNPVNLGFGAANNLGFRHATGEYILLINPDTVVDGNILDETFKFFAKHSDNKSAFGGILLNPDGSEQRGSRRSFPNFLNVFLHFTKLYKVFGYKKSYDLSWLPVETHQVDCVSGACIGMPKAMYEDLGGFDEQFFLHFEDIDLCKRIWQAGYQLWFYPKVRLFHVKGGSSNTSETIKTKVNKWFLDSLGKYLWKWDKPSAIIFSPILGALKLVAWIKGLSLKND
ncbi:glycosyltransferase family 2 protein [Laspinema olomoucense]|uniref:Glycosyltransferase family 2 protein n=1 Tax=Laspinema olomoucense D3b TaxID=2953688 RepID=A0ABT2N3Y5_9CYAN|nr:MULTISPECIES: glycosyltransferase family 2 protein [unclassified Laspinema]MCT7977398.1 glycosyltransferase family 2 protein [Laspinema sp. D3b]MCT7986817.1 glycosyltransferase family 2 protein [Laspinema sp. D3a]